VKVCNYSIGDPTDFGMLQDGIQFVRILNTDIQRRREVLSLEIRYAAAKITTIGRVIAEFFQPVDEGQYSTEV
jgi:hypothetical protein